MSVDINTYIHFITSRLMTMKKIFVSLLLGLYSVAIYAVDSTTIWLETVEPNLKNKIKIERLMSAGETPENQPDYPMAGVADGLGIYREQDKTIILMNHELKDWQGGIHAHGESGAFVSKWTLTEQGIVHGEDLIKRIALYDKKKQTYSLRHVKLSKLCSADLPLQSALFFQQGDKQYGTQTRIFFSGEELSSKKYDRYGRAFAHVVDGDFAGTSFELPKLGRMAFENVVLNPYPQQHTIAMLQDDATNSTYETFTDKKTIAQIYKQPPSQLYVYIGTKQEAANTPVDAAGLNNGQLYGIKVEAMFRENRKQAINAQTSFKLVELDLKDDENGKQMELQSLEQGITQFLRVEDGAWNLQENKQHEFFFTTTDEMGGNSRLYKLAFNDITQPLQGGTITVVLNGNEHDIEMMDNLTVDRWGRVLIQEDPGGSERLGRIWLYDLNKGKLYEVARYKDQFFSPDITHQDFISHEEESSGIVQAFDALGEGWYILDTQSHRQHPDPKIVEHGQLLKIFVPKELP